MPSPRQTALTDAWPLTSRLGLAARFLRIGTMPSPKDVRTINQAMADMATTLPMREWDLRPISLLDMERLATDATRDGPSEYAGLPTARPFAKPAGGTIVPSGSAGI